MQGPAWRDHYLPSLLMATGRECVTSRHVGGDSSQQLPVGLEWARHRDLTPTEAGTGSELHPEPWMQDGAVPGHPSRSRHGALQPPLTHTLPSLAVVSQAAGSEAPTQAQGPLSSPASAWLQAPVPGGLQRGGSLSPPGGSPPQTVWCP